MSKSIVEYVGGLEASIKALEVLRQHKNCCDFWDMFNIYGKGRASRTVKGRELAVVNNPRPNMFNLESLERAVELELNKHLTTIGDRHKVVYNEPTVPPKVQFNKSKSNFWEESPQLIIRYKDKSTLETEYVLGCVHFNNTWLDNEDSWEFRLQGFNGDGWHDQVTGWAYV